jgi:amino-acid N-acetyltransferase
MKAADLRGILGYIARFRDKLFVLNMDSEVLAHANFHNLLLDVSVLRSLNIRIVLVHGASHQIRSLSKKMNVAASDFDGMGVTDPATLQLSILASNQLTHEILEGLNATDQRAVVSNAIIAHPAGILKGVDQQCTGRVEKVDAAFLQTLLDRDVIPVVPPLGFDGNGQTYRVNSDQVALEVAEALSAAKLIFITTSNGPDGGGRLSTQVPVAEAEDYLKKHAPSLPAWMVSKLQHGARACRNGVQRAHIIDGRQGEALLSEIFSNEGVGTMIYANEYESIRRARKKDLGVILDLIHDSVDNQQIIPRTREEIAARIGDFAIFEIDRNVVGCVGVRHYAGTQPPLAELECLCVAESHENQGIGRRLMLFAETQARDAGAQRLLALSTQTFSFFVQKGGFLEGPPDLLPPERAAKYEASGRHSKILYKDLR